MNQILLRHCLIDAMPAKAVFFLSAASAALAQLPEPFVMPWMCLERCNDTSANITAQLQQFQVNSTVLNGASFEDYNLIGNSTLHKNTDLSQVAGGLARLGVQTWAMVSSYPYPPQFLSWMRQVFADPQPFIDSCVQAAQLEGLTGLNIDWEPTDGGGTPTEQDAADYANFLDTLATAMHEVGVLVSVDTATWSPIWNLTAIGATAVDAVMTMQTYTDDLSAFLANLAAAVEAIPAEKLVVGLETVKASTGLPYNTTELQQRFDAIGSYGIRRVGLWRAPVPDNWWPFLNAL